MLRALGVDAHLHGSHCENSPHWRLVTALLYCEPELSLGGKSLNMRALLCLLLTGAIAGLCKRPPADLDHSRPRHDCSRCQASAGHRYRTPIRFRAPTRRFRRARRSSATSTFLTAAGPTIRNGASCCTTARSPRSARPSTRPPMRSSIDGTGKYVTPGIIDDHSHLGVYAAPGRRGASSDGNEATNPVTAERVGRALGVAAGSAVPAQPRRRRHDAPGASRLGESDRRTQRRAQGRSRRAPCRG